MGNSGIGKSRSSNSENRFSRLLKRIFEDLDDLVICYDEDYTLIYINLAASKAFKAGAIGARGIERCFKRGWSGNENWEGIIRSVFISGSAVKFNLQMPDNEWYAWRIIPEFDDFRNEKIVVCIGSNITEETEKTNNLNAALEREKEFNSMLSEFLSATSFEFRTPLTSINLTCEMIERSHKHWTDELLAEYFQKIKKSVDSLTYLVDKVLVLNGTGFGTMPFNPEMLNLWQTVKECIDSAKLYNSHRTKINFVYNPARKNFFIDKLQFKFLLLSLILLISRYSGCQSICVITISYRKNNLLLKVTGKRIQITNEEIYRIACFFSKNSVAGETGQIWTNHALLQHVLYSHNAQLTVSGETTSLSLTVLIPVIAERA